MMVLYKKLREEAIVPEYKSEGASCADMYAVVDDEWGYTYLRPNETKIIQTGIAVELPVGFELQIRARSGLASKGIILSNGVGTIDNDYRGEIGVILTNTSDEIFKIRTGDRIAQCCLQSVFRMCFVLSFDDLTETKRGDGGYGSTGK